MGKVYINLKILFQYPIIIFLFFLFLTITLNYLYLVDRITFRKDIDFYNIANSILLNIIAGFIFYFFISYLPQRGKHKILRSNLSRSYKQFKQEILGLFISINEGSYSRDKVDDLMSLHECREYLNENDKYRFYKIINYLHFENEPALNMVHSEMNLLLTELNYTLNNVEFNDEEIFLFFNRFKRIISSFDKPNLEYYEFEGLMQFLFELLTGWDLVHGYKDEDIVGKMINSI